MPYYCVTCSSKTVPELEPALQEFKMDLVNTVHKSFEQILQSNLMSMQAKFNDMIDERDKKMKAELLTVKNEVQELRKMVENIKTGEQQQHAGVCDASAKVERLMKRNNLIVTGIPMQQKEDLNNIIHKLANLCQITVNKEHVDTSYRMKTNTVQQNNPGYAPPIIISFTNNNFKTQF